MRWLRFYLMNSKQQRFIILRAEGVPFSKIAEELKTAKSTLISWSKQFSTEIDNIQFQSMQSLKEEYQQTQIHRYKQLLEHLKKFDDAITNKNLSEEGIKELLTARNNIFYQVQQMEAKVIYTDTSLIETCKYTNEKSHPKTTLNEF